MAVDKQHRWSGWPGAWCLDCFELDPAEQCLADGDLMMMCSSCLEPWPMYGDNCKVQETGQHIVISEPCDDHKMTNCKVPRQEGFWKPKEG